MSAKTGVFETVSAGTIKGDVDASSLAAPSAKIGGEVSAKTGVFETVSAGTIKGDVDASSLAAPSAKIGGEVSAKMGRVRDGLRARLREMSMHPPWQHHRLRLAAR